jgi:glucosyl-3-phosphoglycerate synthase
MADFYQTGVVATLHRLKPADYSRLEREMIRFSHENKLGLVLPALYSEFETPSMAKIVEELRGVRFINRIVVVLARANQEQYFKARDFFKDFEYPVTFLWMDSERTQRLLNKLVESDLSAGEDGKGRSCWLAYGYLLAQAECNVIALHDCDIRNYEKEFVARLAYPIMNSNLSFEFCKGYYARVSDRMHGRVTRLFTTPLIRAMESLAVGTPFLRFLDSFRYPLAGEFAMKAEIALANRIPGDWGLEVGVLAEVFRNCANARICQVDLADNYDHKHQSLSVDNPQTGLRRMTRDIAKSLFRTLAGEGVVFTLGDFRTLRIRYVRIAQDTIARYYADAMLNGLYFDRHEEEVAVNVFAQSLQEAADQYMSDPLGDPLIPNWSRVFSALPEFGDELIEAVNSDMARQPSVESKQEQT